MPPYPTKKKAQEEEEEEVGLRRRAPGPAAGSSILTMNGNQRRTATDRGLHRAHLHLFLLPLLLIFWPFAAPPAPPLSLPPPSISPCCGFFFEKNYNQLFKMALSHDNLLHFFWLHCPKKCSIVWFFFHCLINSVFWGPTLLSVHSYRPKSASSCLS